MRAWSSCSSRPSTRRSPSRTQVVSIWAGTTGKLDDVPVEDIRRFETRAPRLPAPRAARASSTAIARDQGARRRHRRRARGRDRQPSRSSSRPRDGELLVNDEPVEADGRGRGRAGDHQEARPQAGGEEASRWAPSSGSTAVASRSVNVDQEDHQGDGAHRRLAHRQGAAAGGGVHAVRRGDHPRGLRGRELLRRRAPADHRAGRAGRATTVRARRLLLLTSDRGLAGAYSSNAIKEGEQLSDLLRDEGKEVVPYIVGRKGVGFYRFRNREIAGEWTGFSESPTYADAKEVADALIEAFLTPERPRAASTRSTSSSPSSSPWSRQTTVDPAAAAAGGRGDRGGARGRVLPAVRVRAVGRGRARRAAAALRREPRLQRAAPVGRLRARRRAAAR